MQTKEKKVFERAEIQRPLQEAVEAKLAEIGCEPTPDHVRRTIRSVLRIAAKMALENGCPPDKFLAMATESVAKESGTESLMLAAFVAECKGPNGAKA